MRYRIVKHFYHFYGFKRPTRPKYLATNQDCIEGFFIYFATPQIYRDFIEVFSKSSSFKEYFKEKFDPTKNLKDINISTFFKV